MQLWASIPTSEGELVEVSRNTPRMPLNAKTRKKSNIILKETQNREAELLAEVSLFLSLDFQDDDGLKERR